MVLEVKLQVGRLIEIRGRGVVTVPDFAQFRTDFTDCIVRAQRRVVFVSDLRGLDVKEGQVFEMLQRLMRTDNAMIERSCYFVDQGTRVALEVAVAIKEVGNPQRRVFFTDAEVRDWLVPVLNAEEVARLDAFLA